MHRNTQPAMGALITLKFLDRVPAGGPMSTAYFPRTVSLGLINSYAIYPYTCSSASSHILQNHSAVILFLIVVQTGSIASKIFTVFTILKTLTTNIFNSICFRKYCGKSHRINYERLAIRKLYKNMNKSVTHHVWAESAI